MTDLEAREKRRGPPAKLQPVKPGRLVDKEAHLADYFGDDCLPFKSSSTSVKPANRPITHTKSRAGSISNGSSSSSTKSSRNSSPDRPIVSAFSTSSLASSSLAISSFPSSTQENESTQSKPWSGNSDSDRLEERTGLSDSSPPQPQPEIAASKAQQDIPRIATRLRSSSRLAQHGLSHHGRLSSPSLTLDSTNPSISEDSAMPKVAPTHSSPLLRLTRASSGKENHLPPSSGRQKVAKPLSMRSVGPRFQGLSWGLPKRDGDTETEENTSALVDNATSDGQGTTEDTGDLDLSGAQGCDNSSRIFKGTVSTPLQRPSTSQPSGNNNSFSELPSGTRPDNKRKSDGPIAIAKRMRRDPSPLPSCSGLATVEQERHILPTTSNQEVKPQSESISVLPLEPAKTTLASSLPSLPSSLSAIPGTSPSKQRSNASVQPGSAEAPVPIQGNVAPETIDQPSKPSGPSNSPIKSTTSGASSSPRISSKPMTPQQRSTSQLEGIASIAQSLAVGSVRGPRQPSNPQETGHRTGAGLIAPGLLGTPQPSSRQGSGIMGAPANGSTTANALGRPELGDRPVFMVNNRPYTRLKQVGSGGSSRVYMVLTPASNILALKKVSFEGAGQSTINGFVNEVNLLTRLANSQRIVRLFDAEISYAKGTLYLVMEYGETDLARMLISQREQPFDIHFVGLYWRQMLEAVQIIHEEKIIHSDLKPANFLLVEGTLKLIDFGISSAIGNDTTNLHRELHLGTANYMSPEAITVNPSPPSRSSNGDSSSAAATAEAATLNGSLAASAGNDRPPGASGVDSPDTTRTDAPTPAKPIVMGPGWRKLGRASDVWSLGCILYQMVYGKTPFSDITRFIPKMTAIANEQHEIPFPETRLSPLLLPRTTGTSSPNSSRDDLLKSTTNTNQPNPCGSSNNRLRQTRVRVDPDLIRCMQGCLKRQPQERMTISELLEDPFLRPWRNPALPVTKPSGPTSSSSTQATTSQPETLTLDMDTLRRVMRASIVLGAQTASTNLSGGTDMTGKDTKGSRPPAVVDSEFADEAAREMVAKLQRLASK